MSKQDDVILKKLYPYIESIMKQPSSMTNLKKIISNFINKRTDSLFDTMPCDRIPFGIDDMEEFEKLMKIDLSKANEAVSETYYGPKPNFNPIAAKDEFTVTMLCIIRYLFLAKKQEIKLAMNYLAFSGKFYPSIHYGSFPKAAPSEYRYVMEYVVNNKLTNKYDLKTQGSVIKTIEVTCDTWLNTYKDKLKDFDDEDVVYLIQQLHDRIKSFMKNIASVYYEAYENKEYLTYDSDNLSDDNYHIADSNSLANSRAVQAALSKIVNNTIDYQICRFSSDSNVKTDEVKFIIEAIVDDNVNLPLIEEFLSLLINEYMANSTSQRKDVRNPDFISFTLAPKPNSKNPNIIRIKEILELWLSENSPAYNRRKSREATKNSYHRAVLSYFAWMIHKS